MHGTDTMSIAMYLRGKINNKQASDYVIDNFGDLQMSTRNILGIGFCGGSFRELQIWNPKGKHHLSQKG